ncbi:MAG TPA: peptidase, partial [Pusillimonas sp.]|nr:peptidase [Pusillimonas sp.]
MIKLSKLGHVFGAVLLMVSSASWAATPEAVTKTYADIAHAAYTDALDSARDLQASINLLLEKPSAETMAAARQAWIDSRVPYQQTEAYRFGNPIVDAWEGKVNAWPLDEGMIDYVDASYGTDSDLNAYYVVNVIANPQLKIGGQSVNASEITPDLLRNVLHEADGNEANVATGYHAVEFLLWGQDLNGTGPA